MNAPSPTHTRDFSPIEHDQYLALMTKVPPPQPLPFGGVTSHPQPGLIESSKRSPSAVPHDLLTAKPRCPPNFNCAKPLDSLPPPPSAPLRSPHLQSNPKSLVTRLATFWRPRLLIHPVAASSRMLASTKGRPVRPRDQLHRAHRCQTS